jgi:hypothetical protein
VVIVMLTGCGRVAVSESKLVLEERLIIGRGRGGGIENTLDARKSAPPGDVVREAMVSCPAQALVSSLGRDCGSNQATQKKFGASYPIIISDTNCRLQLKGLGSSETPNCVACDGSGDGLRSGSGSREIDKFCASTVRCQYRLSFIKQRHTGYRAKSNHSSAVVA